MAPPRDDSDEEDELDDELEDDGDVSEKSWLYALTPRGCSRSISNSLAQCSPATTQFCSQNGIPTPPLDFRADGKRKKLKAEQRSKIRFLINHLRQEFRESVAIIFDRDVETLRKIVNGDYDKCQDQLAADQQWFNNDEFIRSFSPILDRKKIARCQDLLRVVQRSVGRRASVSHPSTYSGQLRSKRGRDESESERETNGSPNSQTATGTKAASNSQSTGFGSSQTQARSERAQKRVRFTTGDNVEGVGNDVAARLERRTGKMREHPEETNEKGGKGTSSRLASTSAVVSIPPTPPSVPFTWNRTLTQPPSSSRGPPSSRSASSSRLEPSVATPPPANPTSTRVDHDDAWDEEWLRELLRRHRFECDILVNALRVAQVHRIHIEHMMHSNGYGLEKIEGWLRKALPDHLADSYVLTLVEIIWEEKLKLNSE